MLDAVPDVVTPSVAFVKVEVVHLRTLVTRPRSWDIIAADSVQSTTCMA